MENKMVPYNTGKVLIGCRYAPMQRHPEVDADAVRLQRALLRVKSPIAIKFANIINALKGK
jgi:hypothetical protein